MRDSTEVATGSLLKSIVAIGASLTSGCGGMVGTKTTGDTSVDTGGAVGSHAGEGGATSTGASGESSSQNGGAVIFIGGGATTNGTGGAALLPATEVTAEDCGSTQRFKCDCGSPQGFTSPCTPAMAQGREIHCRCDGTAPLTPADCAHTEQFDCVDWSGAGTSCSCNLDAPLAGSACVEPELLQCHSFEPPIGCECFCCMIR